MGTVLVHARKRKISKMPVDPSKVDIHESWKKVLWQEFEKPYFQEIKSFLIAEKKAEKTIYPPGPDIFNAFNYTPFEDLKVVILGQDPYHGPGQAMGLCFSVPKDIKIPRSLTRIYKELQSDVGIEIPNHGDLSDWAKQGVFMPNAILTVEASKAASHSKIGWHHFTDAVIKTISDQKENVVFLLWGNFAKGKKVLIDTSKHLVLESPHPSPLAGNGFFDNHHFSKANTYLQQHGKNAINWQV